MRWSRRYWNSSVCRHLPVGWGELVRVREWSVDDIEQVDAIRCAVQPWHVASLDAQRIWAQSAPAHAHPLRLCVEVDGRVVSFAQGSLDLHVAEDRFGRVNVCTHPQFRRQGFGGALYQLIEDHLGSFGVRRARGYALDQPDVLRWAVQRGYEFGHSERFLVVDPRSVTLQPERPADVSVVSAAEAGPASVHQVMNTASLDIPADVGWGGMGFDAFLASVWSVIDQDISVLARVDGVPAAATLLEVNRTTGRAMSVGSGTLRFYRGRGLVKLIKVESLLRAASAGVTDAFTANDSTNHAMLAINAWLGYRYVGSTRAALKTLARIRSIDPQKPENSS